MPQMQGIYCMGQGVGRMGQKAEGTTCHMTKISKHHTT